MVNKSRILIYSAVFIITMGLAIGVSSSLLFKPKVQASSIPWEMGLLDKNSTFVGYFNFREFSSAPLFKQKLENIEFASGLGRLREETGVDLTTDIDSIYVGGGPTPSGKRFTNLVVVKGHFDPIKVSEVIEKGNQTSKDLYRGVDLYSGRKAHQAPSDRSGKEFGIALINPEVLVFGDLVGVKSAIDIHAGVKKGIAFNSDIMAQLNTVDSSGTFWFVGDFDRISERLRCESGLRSKLPPLKTFAVFGSLRDELAINARAEAADEKSAKNLVDVVRGALALAKLNSHEPDVQGALENINVISAGSTITASALIPQAMLEKMGTKR